MPAKYGDAAFNADTDKLIASLRAMPRKPMKRAPDRRGAKVKPAKSPPLKHA
jgi:hypothetical protein